MNKQSLVLAFALSFSVPTVTLACYDHMMFNADQMGLVQGTIARMAGLVPPEPVFDVEHPAMAKVQIGEKNVVTISYTRPFFSKNVLMKVKATSNGILDVEEVVLDERSGSVSVGYELADGSGYESIILTVSGEHDGKQVNQSSQIYLRGV